LATATSEELGPRVPPKVCGVTSSPGSTKLLQHRAGDLGIRPGHRLAGRLKLFDRDSLPEGTRFSIGREQAWDSPTLTLAADGRFHLKRVPLGEITIATLKAIEDEPIKGAWSPVPQLTVHLKPGEDRPLEDLEKSEQGRFPDGTDRGPATTSSQAGFLPWLIPSVLAAGALVALMTFKSGRAR
jgi:hypothetical protein